jgi:hypothetical protein
MGEKVKLKADDSHELMPTCRASWFHVQGDVHTLMPLDFEDGPRRTSSAPHRAK